MAEQLLNAAQILTRFKQMRGERMPEQVRMHMRRQAPAARAGPGAPLAAGAPAVASVVITGAAAAIFCFGSSFTPAGLTRSGYIWSTLATPSWAINCMVSMAFTMPSAKRKTGSRNGTWPLTRDLS